MSERCFKCNKKAWPPIKCKCGNISCLSHRLVDHQCPCSLKKVELEDKFVDRRLNKI